MHKLCTSSRVMLPVIAHAGSEVNWETINSRLGVFWEVMRNTNLRALGKGSNTWQRNSKSKWSLESSQLSSSSAVETQCFQVARVEEVGMEEEDWSGFAHSSIAQSWEWHQTIQGIALFTAGACYSSWGWGGAWNLFLSQKKSYLWNQL
jgi:hypothetical protein